MAINDLLIVLVIVYAVYVYIIEVRFICQHNFENNTEDVKRIN